MSKLIIWVGGKPLLHGYKVREFKWSAGHGCYIYGGAEIEDRDFNAVYEKCLKNNADLGPRVKVVSTGAVMVAFVPKPEPSPARADPPQAHEITLAEAEAVVARLAPERLRRRGPRPLVMEVA